MSSRDLVLGRIRAALAGAPPAPVTVPRDYRRTDDPADLDVLIDRLVDYRAQVHRCAPDGIAAVVAGLIGPDVPVVVPPELPAGWLPEGLRIVADEHEADVVITAATVAVAETGTIVLDGSPDQGRRIISLLPDTHIVVLRPDQVVASIPSALPRLDPTRPLTWISGPSATSDIELDRVEGVHGPRNLHVILLDVIPPG